MTSSSGYSCRKRDAEWQKPHSNTSFSTARLTPQPGKPVSPGRASRSALLLSRTKLGGMYIPFDCNYPPEMSPLTQDTEIDGGSVADRRFSDK
jgi:hypothetical protein